MKENKGVPMPARTSKRQKSLEDTPKPVASLPRPLISSRSPSPYSSSSSPIPGFGKKCPTDEERKMLETPKLKLKDADAFTKGDPLIKPESKLSTMKIVLVIIMGISFILLFVFPIFGVVFVIALILFIIVLRKIKKDIRHKQKNVKPPVLLFPTK